jgi:chitinase
MIKFSSMNPTRTRKKYLLQSAWHITAYWVVVGIFFAWFTSTQSAYGQEDLRQVEFRLVGYLPEYRANEIDFESARQLTDLILFSAEPTASGELDLSRLKDMPWPKLLQFKTAHRIRLIVSIGGWERSKGFAAAAGSDASRKQFALAAYKLCSTYRLDGIDLDWEHPKDAKEQQDYADLLAEIKNRFAPHGLTLSITMAAWQSLPADAFQSVDWIQIMAYDHEGKHSTLAGAKADVLKLLQAGAPKRKLTLGVPFYGRNLQTPTQTRTFREIADKHELPRDTDEIDGFYFNGPHTVEQKTGYALESGLGGVMVWEIAQDAPGKKSLLQSMRQTIDKNQRHR